MAEHLTKNKKIIIQDSIPKFYFKTWIKTQQNFFTEKHKIRRIHILENFIKKKNFKKVFHVGDNYMNLDLPLTKNLDEADILLITDQKFSRYTCKRIIESIKNFLSTCPNMYLCLNRYYLNITGYPIDENLPDDFQDAVDIWIKQELKDYYVENLSERSDDNGKKFTWVIADQHFFISKK